MPVTREDVLRTAELAKLYLSPEEVDSMREDLERIFQYFDILREVDTIGVEPMHHVLDLKDILRPDEPGECLDREEILKQAPDRSGDFFRVPRVIK